MKSLILLVSFAIVSLSLAEQYTDRYDDINVDEVLANKRLLKSYMNCVLDKGRCTPEGKTLREHLKDGMQTGCAKCTEAQRKMARKVVKHLRNNEQQFWEEMVKKFDPDNKAKETYEAFLASDN